MRRAGELPQLGWFATNCFPQDQEAYDWRRSDRLIDEEEPIRHRRANAAGRSVRSEFLNGENDMKDQLQILVRAETSTTSIVIQAEGCLTNETVGSLLRAMARASMLQGCSGIHLDLWNLDRVEPEAWEALEEYVQAFGRQPPITLDESCRPGSLLDADQQAQRPSETAPPGRRTPSGRRPQPSTEPQTTRQNQGGKSTSMSRKRADR